MSTIMVSIEGGEAAAATRRKKQKLFQRLPRRLIRNFLAAAKRIQRMDARESARAEANGYNPALFIKSNRTAEDNALKRVISRAMECLDETF